MNSISYNFISLLPERVTCKLKDTKRLKAWGEQLKHFFLFWNMKCLQGLTQKCKGPDKRIFSILQTKEQRVSDRHITACPLNKEVIHHPDMSCEDTFLTQTPGEAQNPPYHSGNHALRWGQCCCRHAHQQSWWSKVCIDVFRLSTLTLHECVPMTHCRRGGSKHVWHIHIFKRQPYEDLKKENNEDGHVGYKYTKVPLIINYETVQLKSINVFLAIKCFTLTIWHYSSYTDGVQCRLMYA